MKIWTSEGKRMKGQLKTTWQRITEAKLGLTKPSWCITERLPVDYEKQRESMPCKKPQGVLETDCVTNECLKKHRKTGG